MKNLLSFSLRAIYISCRQYIFRLVPGDKHEIVLRSKRLIRGVHLFLTPVLRPLRVSCRPVLRGVALHQSRSLAQHIHVLSMSRCSTAGREIKAMTPQAAACQTLTIFYATSK